MIDDVLMSKHSYWSKLFEVETPEACNHVTVIERFSSSVADARYSTLARGLERKSCSNRLWTRGRPLSEQDAASSVSDGFSRLVLLPVGIFCGVDNLKRSILQLFLVLDQPMAKRLPKVKEKLSSKNRAKVY